MRPVYTAQGWQVMDATDGFGRVRRDFYVQHPKSKRLFARELFKNLDLDGRRFNLDALHTQDQTARELVLEHGADYLFTVKDNQPTLRANIEKLIPAPPADFPPSAPEREPGGHA